LGRGPTAPRPGRGANGPGPGHAGLAAAAPMYSDVGAARPRPWRARPPDRHRAARPGNQLRADLAGLDGTATAADGVLGPGMAIRGLSLCQRKLFPLSVVVREAVL